MHRLRIVHRTQYSFLSPVELGPHALRLRPREGAELRIETSLLRIQPEAQVRWHRDVEDNAVAIAEFSGRASCLSIESDTVIQQFNLAPLDFLIEPQAVNYPFAYDAADWNVLAPYSVPLYPGDRGRLRAWIKGGIALDRAVPTFVLLEGLCQKIHQTLRYRRREEAGVQSPGETLWLGTGSCRDFACLWMEALRCLGLPTRFVSGYLSTPLAAGDPGSTHAWAEVYLPGAGWKGFDPTTGAMAGPHHIAVSVALNPLAVPPVSGSFLGLPGSRLDVQVQVSRLTA